MTRLFGATFTLTVVVVLSVALGSTLAVAGAQGGPPKPEAQIAAMAKLDFLVGRWTGEGWTDVGDRRATFRGSEVVERKLDGTVLLVQGSFFARPPGAEADVPVHTTLGVLSIDPQTDKYRFTTWLANGTSGERELTLQPRGFEWQIKHPRGVIRYQMTLSEAGEWVEIGERSEDGTTWEKFFEMKLRKE